ncbi:MAG: YidC/Oxa1 family membrane protein insertase [Clostridia bacterium]|nr:YidC/Oxa1 family membrane protein insertase [Clostridia bacterium]
MIWLVSITSSVALSVVIFTLLLKIVTLPFDFMSRFSMRKNSIKMEQMRPELEKLQKQYADNKNLYNQKMMALYKKNGYSMFGACLPTIITLVIFIIAITGFNSYSRWQNKQYFYDMSVSYNNVLYAGLEIDGEYIYIDEETGAIKVDDNKVLTAIGNNAEKVIPFDGYNLTITRNTEKYTVTTTNGYVIYSNILTNGTFADGREFTILEGKLNGALNSAYNNGLKNAEGKTFAEAKADNPELLVNGFLSEVGSYCASETFRNNGSKFLWVKNIWATDSPMKHPVESDWDTFKKTYEYDGADIGKDGYKTLIAGLSDEQESPNGYFILVALTALSSLLMQLVMGKSQKAQMELQTVDGQGAQTQKMMMWMMPIMMAVFAFMYTAAFSLYIIISSVLSLLTTLLINYIADRKFKIVETDGEVIRGRVYTPPKKEEPEQDTKKKKDKNKIPDNDFLSGLADKKKHYRGRVK